MPFDLINFATPETDFGLSESGCTFPVRETSIITREEDGGTEYTSETHKAILDTEGGRIVGVVGSRYGLLTNEEYFGAVEEALRMSMPADLIAEPKVRTRSTGSWTQRDYVFPRYAEALKNTTHETKIGLRIIASNSYDGGSSARLLVGLIDFYCTNGVIVGRDIQRAARRHSSGLDPRFFVDPLRTSIEATHERIEEVRRMMNTPLRQDTVVPLLEKFFSGQRAAQMMSRLAVETEARGSNVFALHSALTYYSSHLSDDFSMRGSADDPRILEGREDEVFRIVQSGEFQSLLEAA